MKRTHFKIFAFGISFLIFLSIFALSRRMNSNHIDEKSGLKLYWFIPDGLRAEPEIFQVFQWAQKGELPNLKKMMDGGAWGYSRPVFPSHTPVNFATLMTGSSPKIHGIADGAMRIEGYPLETVSRGGFSSVSKKVPSIWSILEKNEFLVSILSVPGSTPPELTRGNTIKGRWGAWGLDFPAIIFHDNRDTELFEQQGQSKRAFIFGSDLTKFIPSNEAVGWLAIKSYSPARQIEFTNWGNTMWGLIIDSTDDKKENYDQIVFSNDKKNILTTLKVGERSDWIPVELTLDMKNKADQSSSKISVSSKVKIGVIKLGKKDFFRVRFYYDGLNQYSTQPSELADKMRSVAGPMVDFVDNYPAQLIYFPEDKKAFLAESIDSLDWHKKSVGFLVREAKSNVVIHSVYTPNQMLTSRWWLPYLDPQSPLYNKISEKERAELWVEVKQMYKKIDDILGEILKQADANTIVALSSDHGALPLYKEIRLNNLFYKKGWLKFKFDPTKKEWKVDWKNSKVVFLQMDNIYINPKGLDGNFHHASGEQFEKLRDQVISALNELKDDETGISPLSGAWKRESAAEQFDLPKDRIGDLIISNKPPYIWAEDIDPSAKIFVRTLKGGYKQAVSNNEIGLLTPFAIMGPGVPKGFKIPDVIEHQNQTAEIYHLMNIEAPAYVTGKRIFSK